MIVEAAAEVGTKRAEVSMWVGVGEETICTAKNTVLHAVRKKSKSNFFKNNVLLDAK